MRPAKVGPQDWTSLECMPVAHQDWTSLGCTPMNPPGLDKSGVYASGPPGLNKSGVYASGPQDWTSLQFAALVTRLQPFYHGGLIVNVNPLPGFIKRRRWVAAERLWGAPCIPGPATELSTYQRKNSDVCPKAAGSEAPGEGGSPILVWNKIPLRTRTCLSVRSSAETLSSLCLWLSLCPAQGHQRHKPNPPYL